LKVFRAESRVEKKKKRFKGISEKYSVSSAAHIDSKSGSLDKFEGNEKVKNEKHTGTSLPKDFWGFAITAHLIWTDDESLKLSLKLPKK